MRSALLVLTLALALPAAAVAGTPRVDVTIHARDGAALKGTYVAGRPEAPAVLLLHMCNTTRRSWDPLIDQLGEAGIHAMALDYRGFGESAGPAFDSLSPQERRALVNRWPDDVDAAYDWLMTQPGVDRTRVGVAGGSCGVTQAVLAAKRHPQVRSLVLLAGPVDRTGRRFLLDAPWIPVFASAAADDEYDADAPEAMRWLTDLSGNPRNRFVGFADGRHGTEIFGRHPELPRDIVRWFHDTLVDHPASPQIAAAPHDTPARHFWTALDEHDDVAGAVRQYHETRSGDPTAVLFPEGVLNLAAYERLQAGKRTDAIALFTLNTEAYPTSANVWDSLGDGYLANGQSALALEAAQKCLELLPGDRSSEDLKKTIRASAEEKIEKLRTKAP